ncbi:hypothetical protein IRY55_07940 [Savagea sp. SN6]|uniref:Homing endonuclease LAGLIDADG domain-containing protein n=1 Tax=Savagea serpentis TaxID=2785297 RepID=A0A8J7KLH4_9BACL|nr:hypothetical protein [Savagea serpentis]MBF4501289.1 hypothetical protein [Savagea serpentis]
MEIFFARMIGKLLGDGTIIKQGGRRPRFQFMHRVEDVEWTHYCYEQLRDYIPLNEPTYGRVIEERLRKGYSERYMVQSFTHEWVDQLYDIWYPNKMKAIPINHLERYFTAESLAWWYQDDGHLKKNKDGVVEKLVLSTECWTDEERELLKYILNLKFNLLFSVDGQKRLLLYDQLQINYFLQLVEPWMQPVMIRKMKTASPYKTIAKRTTIKLSAHYQILKPTAHINDLLHRYVKLPITSSEQQRWIRKRTEPEEMKSYQISIDSALHNEIIKKRSMTGLTLNEVVEEAFFQHQQRYPQVIRLEEDIGLTQKQVLIGSILGDGMLEDSPTLTYGLKCNYHEHFGMNQLEYRQWKVNVMAPYFQFKSDGSYIRSESHPLFKQWRLLFYNDVREKVIPLPLIEKYLSPHLLATLYMDDGSLLISHRINHRLKKIYVTPHIALYVQNFKKHELEALCRVINSTYRIGFTLSGCPDGHRNYIKTSRVQQTMQFLQTIAPVTTTCPSMAYKTNWTYRFEKEKMKWKEQYPNYEVIVSSSERSKAYSQEEIETMIQMKREGATDQVIADTIQRTYWSVVYKLRELRKEERL